MVRFFTLLFLLSACSNNKKEASLKSGPKSELHDALVGQWGSVSRGRPTFDITKDSIYHFGNNNTLPYVLKGNDMIITENGLQSIYYNVRVYGGDTLVFESPRGSEIAALRFKEYFPH